MPDESKSSVPTQSQDVATTSHTHPYPVWEWNPAPSNDIATKLAEGHEKLKEDLQTKLTKQFGDHFGIFHDNVRYYLTGQQPFSPETIELSIHNLQDANHIQGYQCANKLQEILVNRVRVYIKETKELLSTILGRELVEEEGEITNVFKEKEIDWTSSSRASCSARQWTVSDRDTHAAKIRSLYKEKLKWMTRPLSSMYDLNIGIETQNLIKALNSGDDTSVKQCAEKMNSKLDEATLARFFGTLAGVKVEEYVNEVDEYLAEVGHPIDCYPYPSVFCSDDK